MFETFGELVATMRVGGQRTMVVLFTNFPRVLSMQVLLFVGGGEIGLAQPGS